MGHKVNPTGFRLGIIRDWQAKWYADTHYAEFLQEDLQLRKVIRQKYPEAYISAVDIDRQAKEIAVTLHTARPGIVIGRGGQRVDEMRLYLEGLVGKRVRLNIREVRQPELDAYLVAKNIAEQLERRIAYRRAMKQAMFRTLQAGAKGIRISCAGRLAGAEIARRQIMHEGRVPLHTIRADIDYGFTEAHTVMGRIGVKVWIYKGDVIPEHKKPETEAAATVAGTAEKPGEPVSEAVAAAPAITAELVEKLRPAAVETPTEVRPVAKPAEAPAGAAAKRVRKAAAVAEKTAQPAAELTAEAKKPPLRRKKAEKAATAGPEKTTEGAVETAAAEAGKPASRRKKEDKDASA
ncbi:MAG: 30S ribosomal protein S3 [Chloroflexi bacterium]|nr:30S ribosomal protein S3 [Chloroflexota bacterium]